MQINKKNVLLEPNAPVAQLDRVSASEVEGHAFESHQVYFKLSCKLIHEGQHLRLGHRKKLLCQRRLQLL